MVVKEACGLFGVYGNRNSAKLTFLGLYALQHRGQESCGIVSFDGESFHERLRMGLVSANFDEDDIKRLHGHMACGHVRYSTTGESVPKNMQPLVLEIKGKKLYISHNGNLVNTVQLKRALEKGGSIFQTTTDSEIFAHLMASSQESQLEAKVIDACGQVKGAYSLILMTEDKLIGLRDPYGIRPLCLGKKGESYVMASETCALDLVRAKYVRDIDPGEMVVFDSKSSKTKKGYMSHRLSNDRVISAFCIFEDIYFARPDSRVNGASIYTLRFRMGQILAREHPVEADIVSPIPDSGNSVAQGFSKESGIPYTDVFIRNHYVGRTFIQPGKREISVDLKLNSIRDNVKGKRIVIGEDSIVRGNTSKDKIKKLRKLGAKEVHMRVSCPPHKHPCFYGIDFPTEGELIANQMNMEELQEYLELDSLGYLSLDGLIESVKPTGQSFCKACFDGKYPVL